MVDLIVKKWVKAGIINGDDAELYVYGLKQLIWQIINVFSTIIIGLIFGITGQIVIFELSYSILRTYAGGYHARTQGKCYLFSLGIILAVGIILKVQFWNSIIFYAALIVATAIIMCFAPIADKNKPISETEHMVYGRRTRIIIIFYDLIVVICNNHGFINIGYSICLAVTCVAAMLVLARIKKTGVY